MERFVTVFWLLLIPTQLGRHFWLKESSVMGARVDYLSIILYLTDLVWLLWVWTQRKKIKLKPDFFSFILLLLAVANIIFAPARLVAVYKWLRIGQWWLTWQLVKENKIRILSLLKKIVPAWIIVESFLGLAQVLKGGSLNGIWWWLGERRFTFGGIGIAQMRFFDEGWIRAYGTFSHPNSLAGFLLLSWWWWRKQRLNINKVFYWVVNWSAILGIILTGSRIVWGLTLGLLIVEQIRKLIPNLPPFGGENKKKYFREMLGKGLLILGIICLTLGVVSINYRVSDFVGGWDVDSWNKREMLGLAAIKMIGKSPLFGVGAGNFVVRLPKFQTGNFYWMQPVHNIFLLMWCEIGALGIIMFLALGINKLIGFKWKKQVWFLLIVGITGMFDHYWLTLPQNNWLLAIILGLI
ncbi:MAG: hypothetical protein US68_C0004G0014 [Candidatus Shapirobacteria bacterium GW2011_GWE1_38_10]|uniref:O-antigen ligase-related domain-containing protein n=1 Tax=Candidatus Shapirobacteria bacterium GW2011_GWE1_38_10 TaxID=1618488 RepID=A0A0G0I7L4_9BACT|nr:MAG: hypothetical protein US46_C0005G0030 [Candidatus Shapirobacteria bacterium GW2011_GWF2_37_20]KKQ50532.1 MAG: hypothetical protein US68_C0004G0014 [Candidatus Shapirobacteria bacterium GW2011_GWE1_38_10]KKQ64673.1 MAG: hypothetical protein US85_C0005G0021 [Candidatus Shapirobacteria bacterium GW2011_GWF1_38_23]